MQRIWSTSLLVGFAMTFVEQNEMQYFSVQGLLCLNEFSIVILIQSLKFVEICRDAVLSLNCCLCYSRRLRIPYHLPGRRQPTVIPRTDLLQHRKLCEYDLVDVGCRIGSPDLVLLLLPICVGVGTFSLEEDAARCEAGTVTQISFIMLSFFASLSYVLR